MKSFMVVHQFLYRNQFRLLDPDKLQQPAYIKQMMRLLGPIDPASHRKYETYFVTLPFMVSQAYTMSHVSAGWQQAGVGSLPDVGKILTNCPTFADLSRTDYKRVRKACFTFARAGLIQVDELVGGTISNTAMERSLADLLGPAGAAIKSQLAMEDKGLIHQRAVILDNASILAQELQRAELREQAAEQKINDAVELARRKQ
jgi:hypothetical protein